MGRYITDKELREWLQIGSDASFWRFRKNLAADQNAPKPILLGASGRQRRWDAAEIEQWLEKTKEAA